MNGNFDAIWRTASARRRLRPALRTLAARRCMSPAGSRSHNVQHHVDPIAADWDRKNFAVRENPGGVQTFANPYGTQSVELPMTHRYYWTDRQGRMVGADDPSANPNVGSTSEWRNAAKFFRLDPTWGADST